jgi:PAS domain S-box-containing protein
MSIVVWPANCGPSSWLDFLTKIAGRIAKGDHSLPFIDEVFSELISTLGMDVYLYYQADKPEQTLTLLAYRGLEEEAADRHDVLRAAPGGGRCVWPVKGEVAAPAGAEQLVQLPDLSASLDLPVGAHVPLRAGSRCLGSLVVAGRGAPLAGDDLDLLEAVCGLMAVALDRGRLRYQLQTEHARFQALLDHIPAAVLLADASSGRIVIGNPQAEQILGLPVASARFAEGAAGPEELPLLRALSGEAAQAMDYLFRRSDGTQTWLRASGSPIRDSQGRVIGSLITCYDIDQEKRAEAALRQSEEHFRQLADATPQIIWAADGQGKVDYFNKQWFEYTGFSEQQSFQEDGWKAVLHPDDLALTLEKWAAAVRTGEPLEIENRLFDRARGGYRWHLVRAIPLKDSEGRVGRWLGTATDIDERIRRQQELVQADRSKDEFMSVLGHELRNPLAAISYAVSLLELDEEDLQRRQPLDLIRGQLTQISRLIEDLLDLSRVKQGKIAIEKRLIDLNLVAGNAVEATRPLFQQRKQVLHVSQVAARLPLEADPLRLEQVIVNLLNNAAKYSEPGGHIWLTTEREGKQALLTVRDNGIGMTPETLSSIFHLYAQDSAARRRSEGGLGIGLALVDALVKLHQGNVSARSEGLGRGSEFTVRLPLSTAGHERK